MIEVIGIELDNGEMSFNIIIKNPPAGLVNKEEDILQYIALELDVESITILDIITTAFPEYTLSDGQEEINYQFILIKLDEHELEPNQEYDEEYIYEEFVDEDAEFVEEDENYEEQLNVAYDELYEDYQNFVNFGIK